MAFNRDVQKIEPVYVIAAVRTPIGKRGGVFNAVRADDLLVHVLQGALREVPGLDPSLIDDVVVGCAMPEGEQGLNMARLAALMADLPVQVGGVTINRFCASGLQAISMAADRIKLGDSHFMLAAGVESMSHVPMSGHVPSLNPRIFSEQRPELAWSMGITAEAVADKWQIERSDQDAFALQSHQRALAAQQREDFANEIIGFDRNLTTFDRQHNQLHQTTHHILRDEGPRQDTSLEKLARLKPVFAQSGSVTAGNTSQMSDGAAALLLASHTMVKRFDLKPLGRFVGMRVVGVTPEYMGIGPVAAVPSVLAYHGWSLDSIDWIELNEAFAAQSLAVMNTLDLDPQKVNPCGGAIALGHPLGATGALKAVTCLHGLRRSGGKRGLVTMCVGSGMGAAGLFEAV